MRGNPACLAAAPSNKITVNSVTKKKKKGTATINAKVPGPGQVTLNQTSTPPDANATAAAVKQQGLTITTASSFKLAVKPDGQDGEEAQEAGEEKAAAKVKVNVFIHFVPAGVAGVPNSKQVRVTLIKQRKKKLDPTVARKPAILRRIEASGPRRARCYPAGAGCSPVRSFDLQRLRHLLQT